MIRLDELRVGMTVKFRDNTTEHTGIGIIDEIKKINDDLDEGVLIYIFNDEYDMTFYEKADDRANNAGFDYCYVAYLSEIVEICSEVKSNDKSVKVINIFKRSK